MFDNSTNERRARRCAIYTRKSVAAGLEKPVNSLETQRSVCRSYIESQGHRHWSLVPKRYDDGGFSGSTLHRPALQRLINDVEEGQIDVIVIYKVDRLSRSLTDFVRLMDVLDRYGASFVSVTQTFDTSDSMGRLILNILLTFAQFERELASERIRDRCAARRKQGLFPGGMPPIGYLVKKNGLLIPDPTRAPLIKGLFDDVENMSANKLGQRLEAQGFKTLTFGCRHGNKERIQKFPASNVLKILRNPLYAGYFVQNGELIQSKVEPLVSLDRWREVQRIIEARYPFRKDPVTNFLSGILHDQHGRKMRMINGGGGTKLPRYYQSAPSEWAKELGIQRVHVRAEEVEQLTLSTICTFLADRVELRSAVLSLNFFDAAIAKALDQGRLAVRRINLMGRYQRRELLLALTPRIYVTLSHLQILMSCFELIRFLLWDGNGIFRAAEVRPKGANRVRMIYAQANLICSNIDWTAKIPKRPSEHRNADAGLLRLLREALEAKQFMLENRDLSIGQLAAKRGMSGKLFTRLLRVNYLAPEIQAAIVDGTQPKGLTRSKILFSSQPLDWDQQKRHYGFA